MIQVLEMTQNEKYDMYSKLRKKELINMLIEANNVIQALTTQSVSQMKPYHISKVDNDLVPYSEICACNSKNGGNGICGCVIGNKLVKKNINQINNFDV